MLVWSRLSTQQVHLFSWPTTVTHEWQHSVPPIVNIVAVVLSDGPKLSPWSVILNPPIVGEPQNVVREIVVHGSGCSIFVNVGLI